MAQNGRTSYWKNIRISEQTILIIFWVLVLAMIVVVVTFEDDGKTWDLGREFAMELVGGVITLLVFQRVLVLRERDALKRQLIREMRSHHKETVQAAVQEMWDQEWLFNGSLAKTNFEKVNLAGVYLNNINFEGAYLKNATLTEADLRDAKLSRADLSKANLSGVDLMRADLTEANLWNATLQGADLSKSKLVETDLWGADLSDTFLWSANLSGAGLQNAKLIGADLWGADLSATFMWKANLRDANLRGVKLNDTTVLPDGSKWTPDTDLTRFTNPNHPNFWEYT